MKKLFFTTALLLSLSVFGQKSTTRFNANQLKEATLKQQAIKDSHFTEINDAPSRIFHYKEGQAQSNALKSALESSQKLDSTIIEKWSITNMQWEIEGKLEYTYNDKGFVLMSVENSWDENNKQWLFAEKTAYTYDEYGNTTLYLNYDWDANTNQWIYYSKWGYRYDSHGNRELKEVYTWDLANSYWHGFFISESTFDEAGRLTSNWSSNTWDHSTMQWRSLNKNVYEYDSNGNYLTSNYFERQDETSDWEWKKRRDYYYDENEDLIQIKEYSRTDAESEWVFTANTLYTFDTEHRTLTYIVYDWDFSNEVWKTSVDYEYDYDAYGNLILSARYSNAQGRQIQSMSEYQYDSNGNNLYLRSRSWSWNYSTNENELMSDYFYENEYNTEGQLTLTTSKNWYLSSNEWSGSKSEITYDYQGNRSQSVNYQWNNSLELWILDDRYTYYYSDQVISSVSLPIGINEIKTYPNPASDYVVFDVGAPSAIVQLFDMQGKKVLSQALLETKQIDVSGFKRGVYFYKIIYAGKSFSGKIIIK